MIGLTHRAASGIKNRLCFRLVHRRRSLLKSAIAREPLEARCLLAVDFVAHEIGPTANSFTDTMRAADFDGDEDLDFAFAQNSSDGAILSWYENFDGEGSFDEVEGISRESVTWIEVADMDGDGDLDIVSGAYDETQPLDEPGMIAWYENQDGQFGDTQVIADDVFVPYIAISDIDGDGDPDVAAGTYGEILWYENDDGSFSPNSVTSRGDFVSFAVEASDMDGDGDSDIIWSIYGDGTVGWTENTGGGQFGQDRVLTDSAGVVADLATADLDSDGDLDLLVTDFLDLTVLDNQGQGNFDDERRIGAGQFFVIETGDLDNDGDLDLITSQDDRLVWYENDGTAEFGRSQLIDDYTDQGLQATFPADLDGDGDLDILVNVSEFDDRGGKILWYENQTITGRIVGDANGDGQFDSSDLVQVFAAGEYEDDVDGNSTFEEGDWNGDGDFDSRDLVVAFQEGNYVSGNPVVGNLHPFALEGPQQRVPDDMDRMRHRISPLSQRHVDQVFHEGNRLEEPMEHAVFLQDKQKQSPNEAGLAF